MTGKTTAVGLGIAVFIICGIVIDGAMAQHSGAGPASAPDSKKAEEQYKNIQVLKGIPADQLIPAMQFITASLGVECQFCHVQDAFDKDDKKTKQTARKMMAMMFAINKDNFEGQREVSCYTCHRGSHKPVATPAVMAEEPKPAAEETAADYREAGGVKIPFRWTLARPSGRFTIQVSEVKENVPVDDAKFVKPAAEEEKKPPAK